MYVMYRYFVYIENNVQYLYHEFDVIFLYVKFYNVSTGHMWN